MLILEDGVFDSLDDLGYCDKSSGANDHAWTDEPRSPSFTRLVAWLSEELKGVCGLEEQVNSISDSDDWDSFLIEVNSLLRELNCPYQSLTQGDSNFQRLELKDQRLQLIDFLCTELQAARMMSLKNPAGTDSCDTITLTESETAKDLKLMLVALGLSKPPKEITTQQLFGKIQEKIQEHKKAVPAEYISRPLLSGGNLSPEQWNTLQLINNNMNQQYKMRAEMLLKRLDVTVQSFTWSDRIKQKQDEMSAIYRPRRECLHPESHISVSDILAARNDLTTIEKTCGTKERKNTQSSLQKVLMGKVPDRGGRPEEIEPPPPEMPSWSQRQPAAPGGRGGGRGGEGRGGGGDRRGRGGGGGGAGQSWHSNQGQGSWQSGGGTFQMYGNSGGGGGGHGYAGFDGGGGGFQGGGGGYQGGGYQEMGGGYQGGGGGRGRGNYGDYQYTRGRGGHGRGGRGGRY